MRIWHFLCFTLVMTGCSMGGGAAKPLAPEAAMAVSEATAMLEATAIPEPSGPYAVKVKDRQGDHAA
ncbi:MAG: hypothetical protein GY811_03305 [Myxococcales bacterium]|nr:hypothetical protein [Myxococcales bacterium]